MSVCSVSWLFLTLCDSMDHSLSGSSVHGIFWARILEQTARGDLPDTRIKSVSPILTGRFFTSAPPGKPLMLGTESKRSKMLNLPSKCS